MSKQIDVMPCDFCKAECPHANLTIRTTLAYADGKAYYTAHMLVCSHEEACKMQREHKITQDDVN